MSFSKLSRRFCNPIRQVCKLTANLLAVYPRVRSRACAGFVFYLFSNSVLRNSVSGNSVLNRLRNYGGVLRSLPPNKKKLRNPELRSYCVLRRKPSQLFVYNAGVRNRIVFPVRASAALLKSAACKLAVVVGLRPGCSTQSPYLRSSVLMFSKIRRPSRYLPSATFDRTPRDGVVCLSLDLSERRAAEREAYRLRRAAMSPERLAEVREQKRRSKARSRAKSRMTMEQLEAQREAKRATARQKVTRRREWRTEEQKARRRERDRAKRAGWLCIVCQKPVSAEGGRCFDCATAARRNANEELRKLKEPRESAIQGRQRDARAHQELAAKKRSPLKWYMEYSPGLFWAMDLTCEGRTMQSPCAHGRNGLPRKLVAAGRCYRCATNREPTLDSKYMPNIIPPSVEEVMAVESEATAAIIEFDQLVQAVA